MTEQTATTEAAPKKTRNLGDVVVRKASGKNFADFTIDESAPSKFPNVGAAEKWCRDHGENNSAYAVLRVARKFRLSRIEKPVTEVEQL